MCVRDASFGYNFYPYNNCIFEGPVVLNFKKSTQPLIWKCCFYNFWLQISVSIYLLMKQSWQHWCFYIKPTLNCLCDAYFMHKNKVSYYSFFHPKYFLIKSCYIVDMFQCDHIFVFHLSKKRHLDDFWASFFVKRIVPSGVVDVNHRALY